MKKPIRGKVASVLNDREIAINVGSEHGVSVGMSFNVIEVLNEVIKDPDTGEVLGTIERPKVIIKIAHVQEKLSVASAYRAGESKIGRRLGPFARELMPPTWIERYETGSTAVLLPDTADSVKVGDPVVETV